MDLRREAVRLFSAAIDAVEPRRLVRERLSRDRGHALLHLGAEGQRSWPLPLDVVAAGKPAARMAAGCIDALGADAARGVVVTADGCGAGLDFPAGLACFEAGHPLPDVRGVRATETLLAFAASCESSLLCFLGGGASSLLAAPAAPLDLADEVRTNELLLACGADITELNTVRKHLSRIKGGGLLRHARGEVVTMLLSDVPGSDPATIGSGPSVADPTTFADALAVVDRYRLRAQVPPRVLARLEQGAAGRIAETVKPDGAEARRAAWCLLADNRTAVDAAASAARGAGWDVVVAEPIGGDSAAAAREFGALLGRAAGPRRCVIAGGETTVVVRGPGRGGRNQEFALALAAPLADSGWTVLSAGTDGIDGPTDAAGAFVDGNTGARSRARGLSAPSSLAANDSYRFFAALGDLFLPGPTGTNVMDLKVALYAGAPT